MDRKACLSILAILGVALNLASPVAGGMTAKFAGGPASWSRDAALRQLLSSSSPTRLEDGVAPELPVDMSLHRRVLAGVIGNQAFAPNSPICLGKCAAPGGSVTGPSRGCEKKYGCRG